MLRCWLIVCTLFALFLFVYDFHSKFKFSSTYFVFHESFLHDSSSTVTVTRYTAPRYELQHHCCRAKTTQESRRSIYEAWILRIKYFTHVATAWNFPFSSHRFVRSDHHTGREYRCQTTWEREQYVQTKSQPKFRCRGTTFCMVPLNRSSPKTPKYLRSICHTSPLIGDFVQILGSKFWALGGLNQKSKNNVL